MTYVRTPPYTYEHQADATLSQANPVSGTKYAVLNTTINARIISIAAKVTWTVQPDPLEMHVTIDGQALTFTKVNPATNTWYWDLLDAYETGANQALDSAINDRRKAFLLEGRSVKIEAETTGGTVQNLTAKVKYAKRT